MRHRLLDVHCGTLSYATTRRNVKKRCHELEREAGTLPADVFSPQEHAHGAEAEVDRVDTWVRDEPDLDGV